MSDGKWVVTLDKIIELVESSGGFMIRDLNIGDAVKILAGNHTYVFNITDPTDGQAEITSDDPLINSKISVRINGSLLNPYGMSIRVGWVSIGFSLELWVPTTKQTLVLPETKSVSINGQIIMTLAGNKP